MNGPLHRIRIIEDSLRVFTWGLVGLVPFLGLPAVIITFYEYARTRTVVGEAWNPARRYLLLGYWAAWTGLGLTASIGALTGSLVIRHQRWFGF